MSDWKDGLPEDLRGHESIKDFKDVGALTKSFIETKGLVGRSLRPPGPDASEADRKTFRETLQKTVPELVEIPVDPTKFAEMEGSLFERLGRPKEAKEYPKVEVPEGVQVNEEELRQVGHKLGLTKKQYGEFAKGVVAEREKVHNLNSEARKALRTELGDAFEERLGAAAGAAKKLGASDDMVKALQTGQVPPEQAKLWIGVAKSLGHEGAEFHRENNSSGKMTPDEARAQIEELYARPELYQRSHPEQKRLAEKLVKLTAIAEGIKENE